MLNFIQLAALRPTVWTVRADTSYGRHMRRAVFDPIEPTKDPRWYVVRNMHRAVIEARQLSPGTDLKRVFVAAILDHIDTGWRLGEFSSRTGIFFCDKAGEPRMVEITPSDPGPWRHP